MIRPNVFQYSDYRTFLTAYAQDRKLAMRQWSLGVWARKLDLKGTASLTMVLNGQRHAGPKVVESLSRYFKFSSAEKKYFECLVELEKKPRGTLARIEVLEQIQALLPEPNVTSLRVHQFQLISEWYTYAIRQMTELPEPLRNSKQIKERLAFPITEAEIERAIKLMLGSQLLLKQDGRLVKTQENLEVEPQVSSEAVKRYHSAVMRLAEQALFSQELDKREMSALTFAFDSSRIQEAKLLISKFKNQMRKLADVGQKNSVYQLNIQLFALTKQKGG